MPQDQFLDPPLPDLIKQWTHYLGVLDPRPSDRVLDVGCGCGDAGALLVRLFPAVGAVVGLDASASRLARAAAHRAQAAILSFIRGDGRQLPVPDASFDRVLCADTLEWVRPPLEAVREMRRVLRPGGRALLIHSDFDAQVFAGVDARLSREIVHAFNDAGPNGTIGRELPELARAAGFREVRVQVYTLVDEHFGPEAYAWRMVAMMREWLAAKGLLEGEAFEGWVRGIEAAEREGRFFYWANRVMCVCET